MSNKQPHLGCTLSLTSKANIRYEGVLKGIDTDKCTLTLNNVQSHGTEDRVPGKVIPPMPEIYDLIIFNGHDIQDVQVVERDDHPHDPAILNAQKRVDQPSKNTSASNNTTSNTKLSHDHAKSAFSKPENNYSNNNRKNNQSEKRNNRAGRNNSNEMPATKSAPKPNAKGEQKDYEDKKAKKVNKKNQRKAAEKAAEEEAAAAAAAAAAEKAKKQAAEALEKKRDEERKNHREQVEKKKKEEAAKRAAELEAIKKSDFDWNEANSKFDKDKISEELEKLALKKKERAAARKKSKDENGEGDKEEDKGESSEAKDSDVEKENGDGVAHVKEEEAEVFYDKKKSFFDNISCEATEFRKRSTRGASRGTSYNKKHMNRFQERKLNSETFGIPVYTEKREHHGGYRGGFRGNNGHPRGRGGFRGGSSRGGNGGGYRGRGRGRNSNGQREWVNYEFDVNKARQGKPEQA